MIAGEALAGRYHVTERLGRGGTAEVWEAHDDVLRRRVAVKLFHTTGDAADSRRAVGEMHTLAGLSHPNLVTIFDAGVDADRTFIVMELVPGATLAERLESAGALTPAAAATTGAQLAAGLAYIHDRGIVHRDVKPANVLLPRPGPDAPAAKLADFGIAQHAGQERLMQVGMTIGTARYLSPEQITGRPVGPPTDVYALALVLLETLGRPPHWTGTPVEIAMARLTTPPEVPADLGPVWAPLLTAMTASDPSARPTAAQVRDRLLAVAAAATHARPAATDPSSTVVLPRAAGSPISVLPAGAVAPSTSVLPARIPEPPPRERRRRGALWGALAAAVAAVAVVVVWPSGADTPAPAGGVTSPTGATSAPAGSPVGSSGSSSPAAPTTTPASTTPPGQTKTKDKPGR